MSFLFFLLWKKLMMLNRDPAHASSDQDLDSLLLIFLTWLIQAYNRLSCYQVYSEFWKGLFWSELIAKLPMGPSKETLQGAYHLYRAEYSMSQVHLMYLDGAFCQSSHPRQIGVIAQRFVLEHTTHISLHWSTKSEIQMIEVLLPFRSTHVQHELSQSDIQ